MANDSSGVDGGARVTWVSIGGQAADVPAGGSVTLTFTPNIWGWGGWGSGTVTVYSNGHVDAVFDSQQLNAGLSASAVLEYRMADRDGDTSLATATINVTGTFVQEQTTGGGDGGNGGGSPLALDLDRDGVEMTNTINGVVFDIDETEGVTQALFAWTGADDAWLALDKNKDGQINDIGELFGTIHTEGYEILARYNTNGDGMIDARDEIWAELVAWRDLNQDGVSQDGELLSLTSLGITGISLGATMTHHYNNGSFVAYEGVFYYADGTQGVIADVWSKYITLNSWNAAIAHYGYEGAVEWLESTYNNVTQLIGETPTQINSDAPVLFGSTDKIFETNLVNGAITHTDKVTIFYGDDQPGEVTGNGKFAAGGSLLNGALTHDGVAISVTFDSDTGLYTGRAGDLSVFTLQLGEDGSYQYRQFVGLDHAEQGGAESVIILQFGLDVSDHEGDVSHSAIRLYVRDDVSAEAGSSDLFGTDNTADLFMFTAIQEGVQTVHGFNAGEGDALDLSALLSGYGDEVSGSISDFVQMREEAGDTILSISVPQGDGSGEMVDVARLADTSDLDLSQMIEQGNIITG